MFFQKQKAKVLRFYDPDTRATRLQNELWDVLCREKYEDMKISQMVGVIEYLKWNLINRSD